MTSRSSLSRARWATRLQFMLLGVVGGVWSVHVPSVKARFGLDEAALAGVLLATSVGSVLSLLVAGRLVGRFGARRSVVMAGSAFGAALASALLVPNVSALIGAMLLFGAGESAFDVSINAEGSTLERESGRPVMSGFHGMFSTGAMVGAAAVALLFSVGVPSWLQLAAAAGVVATGIAVASRWMLPVEPADTTGNAQFAWPRGTLLVIGGLICAGMLAEGVMYNWSVLYLQQQLGASQRLAALGYVSFAGATALTRFTGDAVRARVSERKMLVGGPLLAAAAMTLVLVIARSWAAIAGFAFVGVGLATIVPILYNAAARAPGVSRAAALASVSSIGYVGFMVGPPLVGGIARVTTLSVAMCVLVVASALVALGSTRVSSAFLPDPPVLPTGAAGANAMRDPVRS